MKRKILFIFALLCTIAQGAWAATRTYEYPTKTKPAFESSYDGKSNVVIITSAAELAYITANFSEDSGYKVDGKSKDWSELNYYLAADIDMGTEYSWLPLGRESFYVTKYEGTFWGNNHTIKYTTWDLDEENQGLFSTIHEDGKVYDVKVDCSIFTKRKFVGGIAGQNYGLIQNCTVTANIVMEDHQYAGGIVGENLDTGTITGCHVMGTIRGTITDGGEISDIGGIAGLNNHDIDGAGHPYYGTIVNCWVEADVISEGASSYKQAELGGICGTNYATIKYCCVTGEVNSTKVKSSVGGIAGKSKYDVEHCTFYGSLPNYNSEYNSKYVGNVSKDDSGPNLFDTFNQAEYDDAVSKGYTMYAQAIKNIFKVTVDNKGGTGTYTIVDSDAATSDLDNVPVGHWVKVYVRSGVVKTFSVVRDDNGEDIDFAWNHLYGENNYIIVMPKSDITITIEFTTEQGSGTEADPYVIATEADWDSFANEVSLGRSYEGQFVMLDGDIDVSSYSTVANGSGFSNAFKGTFDGNGHTLTCIYAPFKHVMDATIKNLHVTDNAAIGYRGSGSIVTYSKGAVKLINCRSSVKVDCQGSEYYGGLVGTMSTAQFDVASPNPNSVTIEGCVFDGSINSSYTNEYRAHDCSGFVGDAGEGGTVVIRNSILKPGSVGAGILSNTFARMNGGTLTIENSYYVATDNLPTNQGTQAHTISGGEGVTLSGLGTATATYGANGITAYATGIKYNDVYYAGSGEEVTLNVSHGLNTGYSVSQYTATGGGTVSGTNSTPTLTMPAADVTIGIDWTKNIDSLLDTGDNTTFINGHDGDVYDITLTGRTLYRDGKWNTLCLPFSVTIAGSPLAGATARPLSEASITGTTLNLTFGEAVSVLEAGTPYIIKWASGTDLTAANLVFNGVTIDAAQHDYDNRQDGDQRVRFVGTYAPLSFSAENKSILMMGAANTLYYPLAGASIGAQRAYFLIGDDATEPAAAPAPAASPRSTSTSATTRPRELFRPRITRMTRILMRGSPSTAAASPPSPRAQAYILIMVRRS